MEGIGLIPCSSFFPTFGLQNENVDGASHKGAWREVKSDSKILISKEARTLRPKTYDFHLDLICLLPHIDSQIYRRDFSKSKIVI